MRWPTWAATRPELLGLFAIAAALAAGALLTLLPERPPVLRTNDRAVAATDAGEGVIGTIATGYRMHAYPAGAGPRTLRDRVAVAAGSGVRLPAVLLLDGSRYALTQVDGAPPRFRGAARLTGSSLVAGATYRVNLGYADGSKLFPDTLHEQRYQCGLAPCPRIGREPLVAALLGLALGALATTAATMLQPFSPRRRTRREAGGVLAALIALSVAGGAIAYEIDAPALAAAPVFAAAGAAFAWRADRRRAGDDAGDGGLLPDAEIEAALERGQGDGDRWVLVAGAAASGKSALVGQMIAAALSGEQFRPHAPPRRSEERVGARVSELSIRDRNGGRARLWFWESRDLEAADRLPPLRDFDGVVLAVDPTRAAAVADTFPPGLAPGGEPVDADREVLRLAEAFAEHGAPRGVWAAVTKADLIRFSVADGLLTFPVHTGPEWHDQLSTLPLYSGEQTRRGLADRLGLGCLAREHRPAFAWNSGSPYLAYSPARAVSGRPPFGGRDLLGSIRDALL